MSITFRYVSPTKTGSVRGQWDEFDKKIIAAAPQGPVSFFINYDISTKHRNKRHTVSLEKRRKSNLSVDELGAFLKNLKESYTKISLSNSKIEISLYLLSNTGHSFTAESLQDLTSLQESIEKWCTQFTPNEKKRTCTICPIL